MSTRPRSARAGRGTWTYRDSTAATEPGGAYLVGVLVRRKLTVLLVTAICVTGGVFFALTSADLYTASAEMLLSGGREGQQVGRPAGELSDRTIQSQIRVVTSGPVLELAGVETGPGTSLSVSATADAGSNVIEVQVTGPDPERAASAANAVVEAYTQLRLDEARTRLVRAEVELQRAVDDLSERIAELPEDDPLREALADQYAELVVSRDRLLVESALTGSVVVVRPAEVPESSDGLSPAGIVALSLLAGLLLGASVAWLLELSMRRVRTVSEAEDATGCDVVALVPRDRAIRRGVVSALRPELAVTDSLRELGVHLTRTGDLHGGVIVFCGATPGAGATTMVANSAVLLAKGGRRVAVIDAASRAPRCHDVFGTALAPGLDEAVADPDQFDSMRSCFVVDDAEVRLLSAGSPDSRPTELLAQPNFARLVDNVRKQFDFVLIDTSAVAAAADAFMAGSVADAAVLVVQPGTLRPDELRRTVERLELAGVEVSGLVLNNVRTR
jgi:polysaccharide biosynthesis transport protein